MRRLPRAQNSAPRDDGMSGARWQDGCGRRRKTDAGVARLGNGRCPSQPQGAKAAACTGLRLVIAAPNVKKSPLVLPVRFAVVHRYPSCSAPMPA
jgi:hypothetical protein